MKTKSPANGFQMIRIAVLVVTLVFALGALGIFLFMRGQSVIQFQLRERLLSTASVAALNFDGAEIDRIQTESDMKSPIFWDTARKLGAIMSRAPNINSAYIMRRTDDPNTLQFVVDADVLKSATEIDKNQNGEIDEDEVVPVVGEPYDVTEVPSMREAFLHASVDTTLTTDQWGTVISGYAPITRRDNGKIVAILGIDMDAAEYLALTESTFSPVALLLISFGVIFIVSGVLLYTWRERVRTLQRLDQERSGLMLLASHQLGEPLAIFRWSVELLEDNLHSAHESLKDAVGEHVAGMKEGITRMSNILTLMQRAVYIHEGHMAYKRDLESLNDIIVAAKKDHETELLGRSQTLNVSLEDGLMLQLDKKLIASVMYELIDNAIHFSPKGSKIEVRAHRKHNFIQVEVEDHGFGIPKKDMPNIFGKFARAENANKYKSDGNGLGLYISKSIVDMAGGSMWVQSTEGKGTTVTFQLPII